MNILKRILFYFVSIVIIIGLSIYLFWSPSATEKPYTLDKTWGVKGTEVGQFNEPTGIAVYADEIFVSDSRNKRIQVFDQAGTFKRTIGDTGSAVEKLQRPMNLTIAYQQLYVADYFLDTINVYSLDGKFIRKIGSAGTAPGEFDAPGGVAVASNGDIYVADFLNQRVQQLHANGSYIKQWGVDKTVGVFSGKLSYPTDVAVSAEGDIYIADGYNDRILRYDSNGELQLKWGGPFAINIFGKLNGWFATVTSVTIGPKGHIFVADFYNDRVQKFDPNGVFLNSFGITSNGPTHTAIAMAVHQNGTVYVADYANHQIQKWLPEE